LKSEDAKRSRIEAAKRNLLPLVKAEREQKRAADFKIIEWGCGAGWNLVPLRDAGFDVSGYDYDRNYVDYGIMEFKLQLNAIIDETIYRIKGQADVLIINHVLEHIEDPFYTLKSLSDVLKPGGVVIIGMPFLENISTWGLKSFFHIAHVHYFGIAHFCRIVERFNWVVKKVDVAKGIVVIARNSVIASDKFSDQLTSFPRARLKNASTLLMQQVKELPLLIKGLLRPLYHWIRSVKLGT
jgi:SAM-dependent methyltransferase